MKGLFNVTVRFVVSWIHDGKRRIEGKSVLTGYSNVLFICVPIRTSIPAYLLHLICTEYSTFHGRLCYCQDSSDVLCVHVRIDTLDIFCRSHAFRSWQTRPSRRWFSLSALLCSALIHYCKIEHTNWSLA